MQTHNKPNVRFLAQSSSLWHWQDKYDNMLNKKAEKADFRQKKVKKKRPKTNRGKKKQAEAPVLQIGRGGSREGRERKESYGIASLSFGRKDIEEPLQKMAPVFVGLIIVSLPLAACDVASCCAGADEEGKRLQLVVQCDPAVADAGTWVVCAWRTRKAFCMLPGVLLGTTSSPRSACKRSCKVRREKRRRAGDERSDRLVDGPAHEQAFS